MVSTLLLKSACNHREDAALLPGSRRVPRRAVLTSGAGQSAALLTLVLSAMVLAAGCGGTALMPTPNLYTLTSDNPFPDVPPCFRTSTVDVLYATDRAAEGDTAKNPQYGYRRSRSLAFGMTTVRIGKDYPAPAQGDAPVGG